MASTLVTNPKLEAALWLWQVIFFPAPTFGVPSTWIGAAVNSGEVRCCSLLMGGLLYNLRNLPGPFRKKDLYLSPLSKKKEVRSP
jgi:hypothetical protein